MHGFCLLERMNGREKLKRWQEERRTGTRTTDSLHTGMNDPAIAIMGAYLIYIRKYSFIFELFV